LEWGEIGKIAPLAVDLGISTKQKEKEENNVH
jgi:hypothetical protein